MKIWFSSGLYVLIGFTLVMNPTLATENSQPTPPDVALNSPDPPSAVPKTPKSPSSQNPATPTNPILDWDGSADPMNRVTSVAELSDVKPGDWAYQTLADLIQRYGAIAGYPNRTFRGNRPLTRYEFAAALQAAIPRVDLSTFATKKDLEDLQRLQSEFAKELEIVKGQATRLERLIRPVSETTKLTGEVIFAPIVVGRAEKTNRNQPTDSEFTVSSRAKLNLLTSLGRRILLRTTLNFSNIPAIQRAAGTDMARLSFQGNTDNQLELDELSLRARLSKQVTLVTFAAGGGLNRFTETLNPFLSSSSRGSISRFGQRNPIYRQGGDAGLGFNFRLSKQVSLDLGYLADRVNKPGVGLGNASYGAIAQLTFEFSKTFGLGLTYVRSFNSLDTNTGSDRANDPFNNRSNAITANSFGLETTIGVSRNLALSGWVGFSRVTATDLPNNPSANVLNWAVTLAFPDLGQEGNLLGVVIGQPPKVTVNEFQVRRNPFRDEDTSLHLETFYRIRLSKGISITPGLLIITNPEHNQENEPIFIGTVRTTFSF
ncbi:iron uptake porin [Leptothermofonsia sp. ETS-13]|uniref:iron uptake porin n=1 Tax=Leptothermofonsia sp. ETS-13 TaxID=3035696 RepID=UPI003BA15C77